MGAFRKARDVWQSENMQWRLQAATQNLAELKSELRRRSCKATAMLSSE